MSHQNPAATSLNRFSPAASNARQLGFLETDLPSRFAEACSKLNLRAASEARPGYGRRSYGAKVTGENGKVYWLKVFGLTSAENERWKAECEADAIIGIGKPELIRQITWRHQGEFWVARLTTFVTGILEAGPWAEAGANAVADAWLETLNRSLKSLAQQPCERMQSQPRLFKRWVWRHFRREWPITDSDWVASHNDLQWSNLSYPDLSILDWEWYGRSPKGYDQGTLIAYSCHNDELVARLEQAFRSAFESEVGHYGKIFAAHTVRNSIRSGWLNPAMRAPIDRLIARWEAQLR